MCLLFTSLISILKCSGYYMYHLFHIQILWLFSTVHVYVFHMILTVSGSMKW